MKQHRLVNETLKQEIEGIHGLQVCLFFSVDYVKCSSDIRLFIVENVIVIINILYLIRHYTAPYGLFQQQ